MYRMSQLSDHWELHWTAGFIAYGHAMMWPELCQKCLELRHFAGREYKRRWRQTSSTLASFQRRNVNVMGKLGMENCSPAIWQVFMIRDSDCAGRKLLGCCSRFNDGRLVMEVLLTFNSFHCRTTTWHMWTFNCLDYFWPFSLPLTLGAVFDFSIKIHFRATQEEIEEERVG